MVLNNTPWMFLLYLPKNFFYDEVVAKWTPIIDKMKLPYTSLVDFMNAQIQTISFPGVNIDTVMQQREQYEVHYPGGKELEQLISKDLNITFKLTESYISYWIMWDQIDLYLHYSNEVTDHKPCWLEPITMSFLSDNGYETLKFIFQEITPTNLGELSLSYAATLAQYNTFTLSLKYNRFDIM